MRFVQNALAVGLTALAACMSVRAAGDDTLVQARTQEVHGLIWQNYIQPETQLLLTRLDMGGRPFYVAGVVQSPSIEDASLYGGMYLDALLQRYAVTRKPGAGEDARTIYRGLIRNCTIIPSDGLLARGVHPDGKTYWGEPSADQYTGVVFGLWRYYRSSLATPAEKAEIANVIRKMLIRLERDHWTVLDEHGKPTRFGDIGALVSTRAERLLALLLAAHDVTREERFLRLYAQEKQQRLALCGNYTARMGEPWVQIQNAMALRILLDLATDRADLEVYERGARTVAEVCARSLSGYRRIVTPEGKFMTRTQMKAEGLWSEKALTVVLRNPWDAIFSILLLNDQRYFAESMEACRAMILGVNFSELRYAGYIFQAENCYWLAVQRRLLRHESARDLETRAETYRLLLDDVYGGESSRTISLR